MEFLYGTASSTEVAYYTYIYAKVDRDHYSKVTSYTYSAIFVGRFFGSIVSQILVTTNAMNYHQLNFISLGCVSIALAFSLCLPPVKRSIYFHRDTSQTQSLVVPSQPQTQPVPEVAVIQLTFQEKFRNSRRYMWQDLVAAYGNAYVLKWSIWWAVATAGHLQIINFIQMLWEVIVTENGSGTQDYNGVVEATHTFISMYF